MTDELPFKVVRSYLQACFCPVYPFAGGTARRCLGLCLRAMSKGTPTKHECYAGLWRIAPGVMTCSLLEWRERVGWS
jgi:hypothetical protein